MTITGEEIERFVAPAISELKEAIHGCVTLTNHEEAISKIEETLKEVDQRYLILNQFETSIRHNETAIKSRLANLESAHGNLEGAMRELSESILQQKNESMSPETKQAWENLHETVTDRSEKFRQGATFLAGTLAMTAGTLGDISSVTKNQNVDLASRLTKRAGEVFHRFGNNNEKYQESGEPRREESMGHLPFAKTTRKIKSRFKEVCSKPSIPMIWERSPERPGSQAGDPQEKKQSIAITESLIDLEDHVETPSSSGLRSAMSGSLTSSQSSLPLCPLSPTGGHQKPPRPAKPARLSPTPTQPPGTVSHVNTSRSYSPRMRDLEDKQLISPVSTDGSPHVTIENRASRQGGNVSKLVTNLEQNGSG